MSHQFKKWVCNRKRRKGTGKKKGVRINWKERGDLTQYKGVRTPYQVKKWVCNRRKNVTSIKKRVCREGKRERDGGERRKRSGVNWKKKRLNATERGQDAIPN